MQTLKKNLPFLLFLLGFLAYAQTPEQQKMIDKAEKTRDSLLACINFDEMLKQVEAQQKRLELDKKTAAKTKTCALRKTTNTKDEYRLQTFTSDHTNKLENWNNGTAELAFSYAYDSQNDKIEYVKVGTIKSDGTIALNPSIKVPDLKPLKNFKNSNLFSDIHDLNVYKYTNENAGFKLNSYILVYQNKKQIGMLTLGNSEKVTQNLLTPGDLYFGDEGYLISWVYADKECSIKVNEDWKGDLSNTETPIIVETNVVYDLNFKKGWNLVKTEVIGTYQFLNVPEENKSRYKKHKHSVVDTIPDDATYYFRSTSNY